MKFNITVDIGDYEELGELKDRIIYEVGDQILESVLGKWDEESDFDKLKEIITNKLESINTNGGFYKSVSDEVTKRLSDKIEKTKQYREIKQAFDIVPDNTISSELREIISNLVKSEMKKAFR